MFSRFISLFVNLKRSVLLLTLSISNKLSSQVFFQHRQLIQTKIKEYLFK